MADNNENISFNIVDTMEMAGNTELINDLMSPETTSTSPDEVQPIVKEVEEAPATPVPGKKPKEIDPDADKSDDGGSLISSFLEDSEEDEELPTPTKVKSPEEVSQEEPDSPDGNQFSALANDLFKLGVFTKDEEEEDDVVISTPEEFLERFQTEKKKGASEIVENFIGQFGEDYQKAFEAIFVKGADPKEYFSTYNNVVSFAEMDLSSTDNQIKVVRRTLTDQGFDEEDIDTEVERLQNYGDLENVATKYHKVLVKKEAQKLQKIEEQAAVQLQQKQFRMLNQYVSNFPIPKASEENEHADIMIETPDGQEVLCRQIAGAMARRIITYAKEGEDCYIDEHLGFIKLGSRVDVFLPIGTEVCVKMGQATTGDQTVIAKLKG